MTLISPVLGFIPIIPHFRATLWFGMAPKKNRYKRDGEISRLQKETQK